MPKQKLYGDENFEIKPLKLFAKDEFIYCLYAVQLATSSNYQLSLLKLNKNLDSLGTIPFSGVINNVDYIYKIHLTVGNVAIPTVDYPNGTYFVTLQYGKVVQTKQLVVRH